VPCYRRSQYLTVVPEVLSDCPSIQEILWNFYHFEDEIQRLSVKDNPHFYTNLPSLPEEYVDDVEFDPTENFQHADDSRDEFFVLSDKPDPIHIMTNLNTWPFGNFWSPKDAIIFKGLGPFFVFPPLSDV
jgi:hypothetical protein